jgi:histidinol-phosphate aminotransferase
VFFPDVTYSFYPVWADVYMIPYETKALDQDFRIVKEDYIAPNGGIIIPNPNAPTGLLESRETLEYIIKNNPDSIVMIDEAYVDFAGDDASVLPLLDKYENLLVIRTFSKSRAMAGVRIGFAMGSEKLIKYINDVKYSINSYTMNTPSLLLGAEAVRDDAYFKDTLAKIINTREWMKKELKALGFTFGDSKSNFVFAKHETKNAKDIFEFLKTKGIYVRYFDAPRTKDYLRITIGTDEEAQILINTLKAYLN